MDWLGQVRLLVSDGELFKEHLHCLAFLDSRGKATEKLSAKRFASYTGLVPLTHAHASGKRVMHDRLTKQGNRWLRWAFIEATTSAA